MRKTLRLFLWKNMRAVDIITKKRDGGELTREEIAFLVGGFTAGETAALTEVMLRSGKTKGRSRDGRDAWFL